MSDITYAADKEVSGINENARNPRRNRHRHGRRGITLTAGDAWRRNRPGQVQRFSPRAPRPPWAPMERAWNWPERPSKARRRVRGGSGGSGITLVEGPPLIRSRWKPSIVRGKSARHEIQAGDTFTNAGKRFGHRDLGRGMDLGSGSNIISQRKVTATGTGGEAVALASTSTMSDTPRLMSPAWKTGSARAGRDTRHHRWQGLRLPEQETREFARQRKQHHGRNDRLHLRCVRVYLTGGTNSIAKPASSRATPAVPQSS